MKSLNKRTTIDFAQELFEKFTEVWKKAGFSNQSEALRTAVRDFNEKYERREKIE